LLQVAYTCCLGDLNQDGYPDLLLTVEKDTQRLARILTSQPCTPTVCTEAQLKAGRRSFTLLKKGTNALYSLQQVSSTAFFDFEEDGTLDMLVMAQPAKQTEHQADRTLVPIQNNYFNDAFFLKTLVLNGVCPGRCPMDEGYARLRPYGVSYHGASFRYSVIDRQGRKHAKAAAQLSQAAYVPLQMPYCLFGLGRTNNYVEELFVGVTRHQLQHYRDWAGVIPNAQLIVVPYQDADAHDPDR
jgi:integrin alpha FG-GAP repeat containing protein 1